MFIELIGKRVVLVIIELFSLGVTAEALRSVDAVLLNIKMKSTNIGKHVWL